MPGVKHLFCVYGNLRNILYLLGSCYGLRIVYSVDVIQDSSLLFTYCHGFAALTLLECGHLFLSAFHLCISFNQNYFYIKMHVWNSSKGCTVATFAPV